MVKIIIKKFINFRLVSSMLMFDMEDSRDMEDSELRVCLFFEFEMLLILFVGWWDILEWDCVSGRNCNIEIIYYLN